MGCDFYLYSPKSNDEIIKLLAEYDRQEQNFFDSNPQYALDSIDVGSALLSVYDRYQYNPKLGLCFLKDDDRVEERSLLDIAKRDSELASSNDVVEILNRLASCQTVISFEKPASVGEYTPHQISQLRFFLTEHPEGVFDWGDFSFVLPTNALSDIKNLKGLPGFYSPLNPSEELIEYARDINDDLSDMIYQLSEGLEGRLELEKWFEQLQVEEAGYVRGLLDKNAPDPIVNIKMSIKLIKSLQGISESS